MATLVSHYLIFEFILCVIWAVERGSSRKSNDPNSELPYLRMILTPSDTVYLPLKKNRTPEVVVNLLEESRMMLAIEKWISMKEFFLSIFFFCKKFVDNILVSTSSELCRLTKTRNLVEEEYLYFRIKCKNISFKGIKIRNYLRKKKQSF